MKYRLRYLPILLVAMALPALTCGVAPALRGLQQRVQALEEQLAETQEILQYVHVQSGELDGLAGPHWIFEGANVHVRSGSGSTEDGCPIAEPNCSSLTGLGNLIVGYNRLPDSGELPGERTGSHNLVVGPGPSYTSTGGLVTGEGNRATGYVAVVIGGRNNIASGYHAAVLSGENNVASGGEAAVIGGFGNLAAGGNSAVIGGRANEAAADQVVPNLRIYTTVTGGEGNIASGRASTVGGGSDRTARDRHNWAAGGLFQPN